MGHKDVPDINSSWHTEWCSSSLPLHNPAVALFPQQRWCLPLTLLLLNATWFRVHWKLGVSHPSLPRIMIMKWHEMKVRPNAYQDPQAGLIGKVTCLVLVSAFSLHATSSSVVVSVGHGKQNTKLHAVKCYLAASWCWFEKTDTDLNWCLYLFSSWWLEKKNLLWVVVCGCIGPAENSENLKKCLGLRISPSTVTISPAIVREKAKEEGKNPFQTLKLLLLLARTHHFVLLAKEGDGCRPLKVGVK